MGKVCVYFKSAYLALFVLLQTLILKTLSIIAPSLTKKILLKLGEKATMTQNPKFKFEDWGPTFTTWAFIKSVLNQIWISLGEEAFVGNRAPDTTVVTLDGKKTRISHFLKGHRPLVLSFGSCT
ncbi:hypothetical protein MATL_G00038500 [Megalops atlanticus]|uniref:Iodothyronine deiodinase n=1 Tax=Megalops atlanticus TaxID=7932 RepID=A0A9D3QJM3_MEGAT|nr:hypothetical protein MATL_G00038500 [Megalops atlanticus]